MTSTKILWIDDEIDLLKAQFIFLEQKGYQIKTSSNATDGMEIIRKESVDIIFLDQNMPGVSGLDILPEIKKFNPNLPVIMITKNEDEQIMDEAIGSKVDGYLIKPVNPNQIILTLKQKLHNQEIINEKTAQKYHSDFQDLMHKILAANTYEEWIEIFKIIIFWDIEIESTNRQDLQEFIEQQKQQANIYFSKFVEKNYISWIGDENKRPPMIFEMLRKKIMPLIDQNKKVFLIVIDNLRYDQWQAMKPFMLEHMNIIEENAIFSILPTVTQYARNSFFSGILPADIAKRYPQYWVEEHIEGNKNDYEEQFIKEFFARNRRNPKISFHKILNETFASTKLGNVKSFLNNNLNVFIFNFIDILSHSKTQMQMIKDLAKDDSAYRALVKVWFNRSYLKYLISELANSGITIVITTDHGSISIKKPVKVIGDRFSSTNIRYKQGKNLNYNENEVFVVNDPLKAGLPKSNMSTKYIFARNNDFLVFPQNYHDYVSLYTDSFQHGGISLEEMIIPFIIMESK